MTVMMPNRVMVVLDDASAAGALLHISCTLGRLTRRDIQLVYVESAAALAAAALPWTQVLAQATAHWAPLAPPDVERAWQAQAGRLRRLAERAALQHAVAWSLQVTRGTLHEAARSLQAQSDLLLLGGSAAALAPAAHPGRRQTVAALDDGTPAGQRAVTIAQRLCEALGARLQLVRIDPARGVANVPAQADLVVMPASQVAPQAWPGTLRAPTLLVSLTAPSGD